MWKKKRCKNFSFMVNKLVFEFLLYFSFMNCCWCCTPGERKIIIFLLMKAEIQFLHVLHLNIFERFVFNLALYQSHTTYSSSISMKKSWKSRLMDMCTNDEQHAEFKLCAESIKSALSIEHLNRQFHYHF